jgi:YbgC/YbaW family acyl-CoA thioester hydrolase
MNELMTNPESEYIVRFQDCDPFNHLNNARYIDYFVNAREDHLEKYYQFNLYDYVKQTGKGWVTAQNQIAYFSPAVTMEKVIIQSMLLRMDEKYILVEMKMWNLEKTVLKSLFWATFVYFNLKTNRSEAHSQELIDKFKTLVIPLEKEMNFEQRIQQVKMK